MEEEEEGQGGQKRGRVTGGKWQRKGREHAQCGGRGEIKRRVGEAREGTKCESCEAHENSPTKMKSCVCVSPCPEFLLLLLLLRL